MPERIWKTEPSAAKFRQQHKGTLAERLGIEIIEVGPDYLVARMPVDERTVQPYGTLHGGASVALSETLGSVGGIFTVDAEKEIVLGLEINANHLRPVQGGYVVGTARPLHLGRTTQVWEIHINDEGGKLVSVSRITLAIRPMKEAYPE